MSMTTSHRVPTACFHRSTQCPANFFLSRMMMRSTPGAARNRGAGGRPQATVIRAPGSWRPISRITPDEMTQSPMRLEVTNRTFGAVLGSGTRFGLRFVTSGSLSVRDGFRERRVMSDGIQRLQRPDGETLAFRRIEGEGPTVVWIGGFRSDMEGTKALALDAAAR